jgi:hypothetical protein
MFTVAVLDPEETESQGMELVIDINVNDRYNFGNL